MYEEVRTAQQVATALSRLGIEHKTNLAGGTGVLGWIPATHNPDHAPTIALRADMDALPILEATGLPYASRTDGKMHACGHDGHTSVLVGTAEYLMSLDRRPNNVLLVFQPAEEGGAGGLKFVQEGALQGKIIGKPVDFIFGLHCGPDKELGTLCTCDGPMMASAGQFNITVNGKGSHAAAPQQSCDPVVAGANIISALQTIASRNVDPLRSVVVSVPMFHAGSAHNVIPMTANLRGTLRTLDEEVKVLSMRRIEEISRSIATAYNCTADIEWETNPYPVTVNHLGAAARLRKLINESDHVALDRDCEPVMGGEDFSFYGHSGVPACFAWLGQRPKHELSYPNVHTPTFNFNDDSIPYGIAAMSALALGPIG